MLVLRAFHIAIRCVVAEELASFTLHGKGAFDFQGKLSDVVIVHNVGERNDSTAISLGVFQTVNVVQNRNYADTLLWEIFLHETAQFRIVSAQSRIILEYDAVDFSGFNICNHPLVIRTLKVAAGIAVIRVYFNGSNDFPLPLQIFDMLLNDSFLILDTIAF